MTKRLRTIITPSVTTDLSAQDGPLTFWKQILPEGTIHYEGRKLNFDRAYHEDLIESFKNREVEQTMFQLANPLNSHGRDMDPERQRALVQDMATLDQLPDAVKAQVGDNPGLYVKMHFFNKKAARAVQENPGLGVSARVRENFENSRTGKIVKRAVVHVLGTIDPKVTGMSPWHPVDLSAYESGDVVDLSQSLYEGVEMAKKTTDLSTATADTETLTAEDIAEMSDEEINALLAEFDSISDTEPDSASEDDDDLEDDGDEDEAVENDNSIVENAEDDGEPDGDTNLSQSAQRQIDLARAETREANARANEALRRQADAEWQRDRKNYIDLGVAPADVDLAAPILNRADEFVVDLSNDDSGDTINVAEIVRGLLNSLKGTIDMSNESGHGGGYSAGDADPDDDVLKLWDVQYGAPASHK